MHSASPTRKRRPDERVEVDPARDDVAARLAGREAELVDHLGFDQRQVVAVGVGLEKVPAWSK